MRVLLLSSLLFYLLPGVAMAELVNLSTRAIVRTGDAVTIAGFIIEGNEPLQVVVQGTGPSLATAGVPNPLPDPRITVFSGQTVLTANDDWMSGADANAIAALGLAPPDPLEAALLLTLEPGAYTVILEDSQGRSGIGLVAVFADSNANGSYLANISTRASVEGGDSVTIGGFIIGGKSPETVVLRGIGPSLRDAAVSGSLSDTDITLFSGSTPIATNDDWLSNSQSISIGAQGINPFDARESAIMMELAPGPYTLILTGKNGATGIGQVAVDLAAASTAQGTCADIGGNYSNQTSFDISCDSLGSVTAFVDTVTGTTTLQQVGCDLRATTPISLLLNESAAIKGSIQGNSIELRNATERAEVGADSFLYQITGGGSVSGDTITLNTRVLLQGTQFGVPVTCTGDAQVVLGPVEQAPLCESLAGTYSGTSSGNYCDGSSQSHRVVAKVNPDCSATFINDEGEVGNASISGTTVTGSNSDPFCGTETISGTVSGTSASGSFQYSAGGSGTFRLTKEADGACNSVAGIYIGSSTVTYCDGEVYSNQVAAFIHNNCSVEFGSDDTGIRNAQISGNTVTASNRDDFCGTETISGTITGTTATGTIRYSAGGSGTFSVSQP